MGKNTFDLNDITAEQGRMIFDKALENGDLGPALFYMACALAKEPTNEEGIQKIDELIKNQPNLIDYLELDKDQYYPKVALAAYISYKEGNVDDGIDILRTIFQKISDTPYMIWIDRWVKELIKDPKNLKKHTLTYFIMHCLGEMDRYVAKTKSDLFKNYIILYNTLATDENEKIEVVVDQLMVMSLVKRRADDIEGGLADALKTFEYIKDTDQASFIGQYYRDMGDIENAKVYFEKAIALDRQNIRGYTEMADLLFNEHLYEQAATFYKKALEIQPINNDSAEPCLYFCNYMVSKNQEVKQQLVHYKEKHPYSERAAYLLNYMEELERKPYEDFIPLSAEAACKLLYEVMKQEPQGRGHMDMTSTAVESPSAINALRLYVYDYDEDAKVVVNLTEDAIIPDLSPISDTGIVFWNYDEDYQQTPAVKKPNDKVKEIVMQLASTPYSCKEWYRGAKELAKSLSCEDIEDLYGVMVYPPHPTYEVTADGWLMRVQYAAVFLLAHIDRNKKRFGLFCKNKQAHVPTKSLVDICYGQLDWPIIPAIVVLAYQAQLYPECQEAVKEVFTNLMKRRDDRLEYCFFEDALVNRFLKLSNLDEALRNEIMDWQQPH